jgi:tRNA pseudouridine13 synthase
MGPDCVRGNRFEITVRSVGGRELRGALATVPQVLRFGCPNYFDDQRFGSFDPRQGFIAEKIIREHFNGALKIYMTHIHPEDNAAEKERKHFFSEHWGAWRLCRRKAGTVLEETVFGYLAMEPKGFVPLLQKIPREEMSLFFSAYQSFLWNEVLRRGLVETVGESLAACKGTAGDYLFYDALENPAGDYLMSLCIPTAAAVMKMPDDRVRCLYRTLFEERRVKPSMFNIRSVRQAFFKSTGRKAVVMPESLSARAADDEIYQGRKKLTLRFVLPRGSYGSILIKRLFIGQGSLIERDQEVKM